MKMEVKIEVVSDFICPWCYLGKVRLARIKEELKEEINLNIVLRPYLLYPQIPPEGLDKSIFANKTKPGMGRSLRAEAEIEGIEINYQHIITIPSSRQAHRLIELVDDPTVQFTLAHQIFYSYFEEGKNIGSVDHLVDLGRSVSIGEDIIEQFANSDEGFQKLEQNLERTKEAFITVVPSLHFDNKIWLSGLQPVEIWMKYIRRIAKMKQE